MSALKIRTLLLAGGAGTRLWPLSTESRPKQFLELWGGRSLLRDAYERIVPLGDRIDVATAVKYRDLTLAELPEIPAGRLLLEPHRRNTGPAILCAALRFAREGDAVTAVVPADQTVSDAEALRAALRTAAETADREGAIVTLGISPTRAETEFGYIEADPAELGKAVRRVRRFVEKPDAEAARGYLEAGNFFWNAGMFVFRPSALLELARTAAPELLDGCRRYDERKEGGEDLYGRLPSISFDYAIMEQVRNVFCVPCDPGWNDVGSYRALRELLGCDDQGNLVISRSGQPVVAVGVTDSVIAATEEGILVFSSDREGELREVLRSRSAGGK